MEYQRSYFKKSGEDVLLSLNSDPVPMIAQHPPNFTRALCTRPSEWSVEPPGEKWRFAKVVDNLLSQEQCDQLIAFSEQFEWGMFGSARTKKPTTKVRSVWRILVDCPNLADSIFALIQPYLPQLWKGSSLVGFNCRFRFLKYEPKMHHRYHRDNFYEDPVTKNRTQFTVMLYLSGDCTGGETLLLDPNRKKKPIVVSPDVGRALIFEHGVFHSGNHLKDGEKRALRLDVLYSPPSERESHPDYHMRSKNKPLGSGRRTRGRNKKRRTDKSDFARFGTAV